MNLVHPVHRATHRIGIYLSALPGNEVTQGEAHILALLARSQSASVAELHRGLAHKRSTLTSILDRLAERRLIKRNVSDSDRRSFAITLTSKGARLARRIHRHLSQLERTVMRGVSAKEAKGFSKVIAALEREADRRATRPRHSRSQGKR